MFVLTPGLAQSSPEPAVELRQSLGEITPNGDGSYSVDVALRVENTGNEKLVDLQIKDNLDIFGPGSRVTVSGMRVLQGSLRLNPGYDGLSDIKLLKGGDSLLPGEYARLMFTLTFVPGESNGPFTNRARVTARGELSDTSVTDAAPCTFSLPLRPEAQFTKSAREVSRHSDGRYIVTFTLNAQNTGSEDLVDIQFKDDLDIFGPGSDPHVRNVRVLDGDLALNPAYDGVTNHELLKGTDRLLPGDRARVRFDVLFDADAGPLQCTNRALFWAEGGETGIGLDIWKKVTFDCPPAQLGADASFVKQASEAISNNDGTYTTSFTLDATNTGAEDLIGVQFKDELDFFGPDSSPRVGNVRVLDGNLTLNPDYDGAAGFYLLAGTDRLHPGDRARVRFDVTFDATGDPGQCTNRALFWAESSESGVELDLWKSATFECPPAPAPGASIGLTKQASEATALGGGEYSSEITLTVTNTGDEQLNEVQVEDPLDIFGSGTLLRVEDVVSGTLTLNPGYDGSTDASLLAGTDVLASGESGTITFTVVFSAGDEPGPFLNRATTGGTGEDGGEAVDGSDEAEITLPAAPAPQIEIDQDAGIVTDNGDGTESVEITLTVTNTGTEALTSLQLTDELDIFGNGQLVGVEGLDSDELTVNALFDGGASQEILTGADSLGVGESAAVGFVIRFGRGPEPGPFTNVVTATAVGEESGDDVSDSSAAIFGGSATTRSAVIAVTKVADRTDVSRGDIVGYDVGITNLTSNTLGDVQVTDTPPAGFEFVQDSALLIRAGPDGRLGTFDDVSEHLGAAASGQVVFDAFDLAPNEGVIVRYASQVGAGVADGEHINSVVVSPPPFPPVSAAAPVTVVRDPMFEKTTVIGKVFEDRNGNFYPDPDEPGIPGVRLATVGGLTMETDAEGRYHLADVDVERFERGANFIVKLDEASLPGGGKQSKVISENPRVLRLTQATLSKINFAVGMADCPEVPVFHTCLTQTRYRQHSVVEPVRFVSGVANIPDDFGQQLRDVLRRHRGKRDLSIVMVGHADSDPVNGRLAARLGAGGEAGNVILSRNRAMNVCLIARDELEIPVDCDNVRGMGSSAPVASNQTPAGKALNRRVEIQIEYTDSLRGLQHDQVKIEACAAQEVVPYREDWYEGLFGQNPAVTTETHCILHTGPLPEAPSSATARQVRVSGGNFGCDTLVAQTLPGRENGGEPGIGSEVTIYASTVGNTEASPGTCPDPVTSGIVAGRYPVEVRTGDGSVLLVEGDGDVRRIAHPQDPNDFEHIVVTPLRDETDQSKITALRITNDGIEPLPGEVRQLPFDLERVATLRASADSGLPDPRLDVLALDAVQVDGDGRLAQPVRFAVFTNYDDFIDDYVVEIYGGSADGPGRNLIDTLAFTDWQFDRPPQLPVGSDLSNFDQLEYVLKATQCNVAGTCFVDRTHPRTLETGRSVRADGPLHDASELWGMSNLAVQRIPVTGGKVRVHCPANAGGGQCRIGNIPVPARDDGSKVLEQHRPQGEYFYEDSLSGTVFGAMDSGQAIPAVATGIEVSGGKFGCGGTVVHRLPGRESQDDVNVPAITVMAEADSVNGGDCAGQTAIEIRTAEGTVLNITSAGDVRAVSYPLKEANLQQIVVTPFRDYSDPEVVSAVRIVNEGLPFIPQENPLRRFETAARVTVTPEYGFLVAMANLTIGQNNLSGNAGPLGNDAHFDGSTFVDGRLAFYGKRVTEDYSLTAQLDSSEDELRHFTDNLRRKDPRRVFRQLDPNRYYPVYGDDSTTTTDVDTQGAFYLRVDWDNNSALWGNYNTGMTDTEYMQYNRSLYGAKLRHESRRATRFGDARTELNLFGSEAQSTAAHVTFKATGGSLYYLRDTDIVMGSEKVWVEVRRRDTQQVVERQVLLAGRDYEVDPLQGRIILRQPLSQVVNDRRNSIIRSAPLEGDEVYLLVDYEYVPPAFGADDLTYGGRGHAWFGDHLGIGLTAIADERAGTDYEMNGLDVTLKASEGSYLRAEIANSTARQNDANFLSLDGGLSFASQVSVGPGDGLDGDALALEGRIDLADLNDGMQGDIHAWSKHRDADFSTGRLGQGVDVNDSGVELVAGVGSNITVSARYTDFEFEQVSRERVASVQADGKFGKLEAGLELRHEDVDVQAIAPAVPVSGLNRATADGEALLVGGRVGYDLGEDTLLYGAAQAVATDDGDYAENDLVSIGVNTRMNDELAVSLEASDGDRGSALIGGVDYAAGNGLNLNLSGGVGSGAVSQFATRYAIGDGHELYGSYAVDPDRTEGARNLLTLGQRRAFGNSLDLFAESQFGKDDRYANVAHVFGMDFDGTDDWRFSASLQFSENDGAGLQFDRRALSFGAYRTQDDLKLSTRAEYREDEGTDLHNRQYVSSSSFSWMRDDSSRWLGLLNFSWTDDELNGGRDARFVELDLGYAWRPVANDRLNLIGKYAFLYDLPTEGQASIRPDEKSHLVSVEGIYDLSERWELAAKLAIRNGERRVLRDAGPWQDFGLRLASVRARYHFTHRWDGLAEYRWLSDIEGDGDRHGALAAIYRHLGENLKVGVGYNFTDFDDRLRIDSYRNHGWFADLVGKY